MSESEVRERYARELWNWADDRRGSAVLLPILARYHDEVLEEAAEISDGSVFVDGLGLDGSIEAQIGRAIRAKKVVR